MSANQRIYTCDRLFHFKRSRYAAPERRVVTTTSSRSQLIAEARMRRLVKRAERANDPSILLGKDVREVSSLWI